MRFMTNGIQQCNLEVLDSFAEDYRNAGRMDQFYIDHIVRKYIDSLDIDYLSRENMQAYYNTRKEWG